MNRSFRQGVLVGLFAPLAFLAGVAYWIFRATRKVPFPVERSGEGALVIRLVEPEEAPIYWARWRAELAPMVSRLIAVIRELAAQCRSVFGAGER